MEKNILMKQFYLTSDGHPIKTNNPSEPMSLICIKEENEKAKDYKDRCEKEYKKLCKEKNDELENEQKKIDEQVKVNQERDKIIRQKMYEMAEQELIKDGKISELKEK